MVKRFKKASSNKKVSQKDLDQALANFEKIWGPASSEIKAILKVKPKRKKKAKVSENYHDVVAKELLKYNGRRKCENCDKEFYLSSFLGDSTICLKCSLFLESEKQKEPIVSPNPKPIDVNDLAAKDMTKLIFFAGDAYAGQSVAQKVVKKQKEPIVSPNPKPIDVNEIADQMFHRKLKV